MKQRNLLSHCAASLQETQKKCWIVVYNRYSICWRWRKTTTNCLQKSPIKPEVATKVDTMCSPNRFCIASSPRENPSVGCFRQKSDLKRTAFLASEICCEFPRRLNLLARLNQSGNISLGWCWWHARQDLLNESALCYLQRVMASFSTPLPLIVSTEGIISWKSATSWGDNGTAANATCHPVCAFGSLTFSFTKWRQEKIKETTV